MRRPNTWMPFYIGDYIRDTARLNTEGHGAYMLLIFDYWVSGQPLPDDDQQLAAIARLPIDAWRALRPALVRFFQVSEGVWRHKRIDLELQKAAQITSERSKAGARGAAKRWQSDGKSHGKSMANGSQTVWQNDAPSPSPVERDKSLSPARAREALEKEFAEWWAAYPHPVGKHDAELKFAKARKLASQAELLAGIARYKRTKRDDAPWCNPATWLFQQRWLDQPDLPFSNGHDPPPPRAAINPKILGHSLPCSCPNCSRWVEQLKEA